MVTITSTLKQFGTLRIVDQFALLVVVASITAFAGLVCVKVGMYQPLDTAAFLVIYAMFARGGVLLMWYNANKPEVSKRKGMVP